MAYPNAIFSLFAFIGFIMCILPFPWHPEAWSTGVCMYMIWTGLSCLNQFINSIIWSGNAINFAPVWCDISTKLVIGAAVAIPAASLTINRRLYHISTGHASNSITISKSQRRHDVLSDLCICLGLPLLEMILHYIVQGHRYNIYEDLGCWPSTYNTPPAYALVFCPPVAIGCVSAVYGVRSIININKRRTMFNDLLSSHSNLNSSIYIRLMCLAGIEAICTVPLGLVSVYYNTKSGIHPWISWENTHLRFSRVQQILAIYWRADPVASVSLELSRWLIVVCALTFFAFFGFADEATKNYRSLYRALGGCFGRTKLMPNSEASDRFRTKKVSINRDLRFASNPSGTISSGSISSIHDEVGPDEENYSTHSSDTSFPSISTKADLSTPEVALTRSTPCPIMYSPQLHTLNVSAQKEHTYDIA